MALPGLAALVGSASAGRATILYVDPVASTGSLPALSRWGAS